MPSKKKVVLFLVEGPSDETAIRGPVNLLIQSYAMNVFCLISWVGISQGIFDKCLYGVSDTVLDPVEGRIFDLRSRDISVK